MLSSLFLVVFFAAVVTANLLAGPYQALFFYQVYRLDVDAYGLEDCHMASNCRKNSGVCDFETFMRQVSKIKKYPEFGPDKKPIRDPATGKVILLENPDFNVVDWERIGEGDDLGILTTEMQKSKFSGNIENKVLFKGWSEAVDTFDLVMSKAEEITTNAISKLKADGREPAQDVTRRMLAALQTHANARRCDQARTITNEFTTFMQSKGFSVALTDPIERPPVPSYQQVDIDQTISDNPGLNTKLEQTVRDFVIKENSSGLSEGHVAAIKKALDVYNNLAEACRAA